MSDFLSTNQTSSSALNRLVLQSAATYENGALVSGNYFDLLEVKPLLGRLIGTQDDVATGEGLVAVVSYQYWRDRLGSDPNAIGKSLTVNAQTLTIVGVVPESFEGVMRGYDPAIYVPLTLGWHMQPERKGSLDLLQSALC